MKKKNAKKKAAKRAPRARSNGSLGQTLTQTSQQLALQTTTPPTIVEATPTGPEVLIDLACGQTPREGYQGVDIVGGNGIIQFDILKYPWPWSDNSVDKLHCSHFIEHIPMIEVDQHGNQVAYGAGQDALFRFFDEAWRVLKPDGLLEIIWPCSRSDRAFWDPTHRRFLPAQFLMYLNDTWRKTNKLDHYNVHCNFVDNLNFTIDSSLNALSDEARQRHFQNYWNAILDFWAKLRAIKPGSTLPPNQPPQGEFTLAR